MFTFSATVPRITRAQVAEMEASIPGFSKVATVPVIETEEQALHAAEKYTNQIIERREYIVETLSVEETETGWAFKFRCSGD